MPTSIGLRWYQTGTVSVTQGSTALTGVGTNWAGAGIKAGDIFTIDNSTLYEVLTVNSNESITLATAFAGVTGETLNYSIIRNFAATMQAEIAAQVALLVNKYETYIDTELETITGPKGAPGIDYKGTWAANRTYNAMDAVIYNNVLYLAKVPHISSAGNAPGTLGSVWVDMQVTVPAIINDLVTGGTNAALSAQMGVELHTALSVDVLKALREASGAGLHNCIYRGKNLGSTFTAAQANAINAGTFDDLFIGDFWSKTTTYTYKDDENVDQTGTITVNWRIADCDYYLHSGNTECTTHHLIVVPDINLFARAMNPTNDTTGAYVGSEMRTKSSGLARAKALFLAAFGAGTLLSHRLYLQNAVTNGMPSGGAWMDSDGVELMTEEQVYGGLIFDSGSHAGTAIETWGNRYHVACKQLNLFRHRPDMISNRQWFWLQNVVSPAHFASVDSVGMARYNEASVAADGVRPAFVLRKAA